MKRLRWGLLMVVVWGFATPADTRTLLGFRFGFYAESEDAFLGAEALVPLRRGWFLNPNVENVFAEGVTFVTFNVDVHYDLPVQAPYSIWVGGGLAVLYRNPEGRAPADTDVGINVLFGLGWHRGNLYPYVQGKVILSDEAELVLGLGLRF